MKNTKKFIIFTAIAVVTLAVALIMVLPKNSGEERAVKQFVSAVNRGDVQKIKSFSSSEILGDFWGIDYDYDLTDYSKTDLLKSSGISVPSEILNDEDAELKQIKVIAFAGNDDNNDSDGEDLFSLTSSSYRYKYVTALIEITYDDSNGDKQTYTAEEEFAVLKYNNKYAVTVY